MSHYSNDPSMVRVDFFKETGKWYTTEAIKWDTYRTDMENFEMLPEILARCINQQIGDRLNEMVAVCLEPYHEHSYPVMIFPRDRRKQKEKKNENICNNNPH